MTGVPQVERAQNLDGPADRTGEAPALPVVPVVPAAAALPALPALPVVPALPAPRQLNGRDQVPHDR